MSHKTSTIDTPAGERRPFEIAPASDGGYFVWREHSPYFCFWRPSPEAAAAAARHALRRLTTLDAAGTTRLAV